MLPVLFHVGSFPIRSFGVALIVGFVLALLMAKARAPRYGIEPSKVWDLAFGLLIFGVLGSRVLFILQELPYYLKHTNELFSPQFEGLTSFGGILAGFVVIVVWSRRHRVPIGAVLDMFAVPFLIAHAVGRIGCLLNGCCYGGPTDLPWGVHFHDVAGIRQPAQIYDTLMTLAGAGLLLWIEKHRHLLLGQSFSLMLVIYGASRFIFEFWRAGSSSTYWGNLPITQAQAMALLLVLAGSIAFALVGRRARAIESSATQVPTGIL